MIRFTKAKMLQKAKPRSRGDKKTALDKLYSYLNAAEPEAIEFLVSFWNTQAQGVTYVELREAYLAGEITPQLYQRWTEDYSRFIQNELAPLWAQAAQAGTAEVSAKYPKFVYEPSISAAMGFIKEHGAELVTNITEEQRRALNAVVSHISGYTAITPDEAARMIRPTVGLTVGQTLANVRHRQAVEQAYLKAHPNCNPETAKRKAEESAARYAGRQHRYRAQNIARTELAFAYNAGHYGATRDAQEQGYIGDCTKTYLTADDERVCPICGVLDGEKRNMSEPFSFGKLLPPAHPSCRCAVAYEEIPGTNLNPSSNNDIIEAETSSAALSQQPTIPPDIPIPDGMTYQKQLHLGGTGEMHLYTDASGNEWIFKPAQSKGGSPELFRAYSQEAGYKIQCIVDPDTAVPVGVGTLDGRFGAFQRRIDTVDGTNFKVWQHSSDPLPAGAVEQFQRENVTDWLLGNFDSHGGNFVTDNSGRMIGIDKEQAFKYIKDPASHKMSFTYHPNSKYGETEPIYNTLYRRYANGEIDIDLQDTLKFIQRVEAIPDAEYRQIFRNYAESVCGGNGKTAEQLLDSIVERKQKLRETFRDFYTELEADRKGIAAPFRWADELTDTVAPKKPKKPKQSKPKPQVSTQAVPGQRTESGYRVSDVLNDITVLPQNSHGVAIRSDGGMVEGLNLTGRRINIDGSDYYEISGKLTENAWAQATRNIKRRGHAGKIEFLQQGASAGTYSTSQPKCLELDGYKMATPDSTFEIYSDYTGKKQFGMGGYFRVRVPATGSADTDRKAMRNALDTAGLRALTADPTDAEELLLKKARLAWQRDPKAMEHCRNMAGDAKEREIDRILRKAGIDDKRVQGMKLKEVFPGYTTYVDESALMEYKRAGLTHIWAGVDNADAVVAITQSDGFAATNYRCIAGMKTVSSASPDDDMKTGGSDSVFTRIGVNTDRDYSSSFLGSRYRIIIDPEEMMRTDWYAYTYDNYGNAKMDVSDTCAFVPFDQRSTPVEFIRKMNKNYAGSNEIMFRHGISAERFVGISCENDSMRQTLLDKFAAAGVTELRGIPIEDFVITTREIKEDCKRGILGLDFYDNDAPVF